MPHIPEQLLRFIEALAVWPSTISSMVVGTLILLTLRRHGFENHSVFANPRPSSQ